MHDAWLSLVHALSQTMRDRAPGWTDRNDADPGVTILEVIAYLAHGLRLHGEPSEERWSAAARAIEALEALAGRELVVVRVAGQRWQRVDSLAGAAPDAPVFTFDHSTGEVTFGDGVHGRVPDAGAIVTVRYRDGSGGAAGNTSLTMRTTWPAPCRRFSLFVRQRGAQPATTANSIEHWSGATRPNYFPGMLLSADDLREEQQYHLGKHRRHLQTLHGWGVANGLDVAVASDGNSVTVGPGVAIDALGHEIVLDEPAAIAPPGDSASPAWVVLEYAERAVGVVSPAVGEPQASRIEDGCRVTLTTSTCDTGVTVARLVSERGGLARRPHVRSGANTIVTPSCRPARARTRRLCASA